MTEHHAHPIPTLQATSLGFGYDDVPLFRALSFTLCPGDVLHIRGENGAGKSTLLKLLVGLLYPVAGEIFFEDRPIREDLKHYHQHLHYLGHRHGHNGLLTVMQNLHGLDVTNDKVAMDTALKEIGLFQHRHEPACRLSAGERRRVSLLRLHLQKRQIWILDEPLTALDPRGEDWLVQHIKAHLASGGMMIYTSHQPFRQTPSWPIMELMLK